MTKNDPLFKAAREVIRREMHLYDKMAMPSRIRYEAKVRENIEVLSPYRCAHDVWLHEPCTKCERSEEETLVYKRQFLERVKELLKQLGQ